MSKFDWGWKKNNPEPSPCNSYRLAWWHRMFYVGMIWLMKREYEIGRGKMNPEYLGWLSVRISEWERDLAIMEINKMWDI